MADKLTGLGMTIKEHRAQNGEVTIADACQRAAERFRGAKREKVELGQLNVTGSELVMGESGEVIAEMDDYAWGLFCKLLNIPQPYLNRLGSKMRAMNVNYWLTSYHDKEVVLVHRDGELLDIKEGIVIEQSDVLDILNRAVPGGIILRASNPTNAVMWDIVDTRRRYEGDGGWWVPGMRVVVKEGLNAPDISPIFVSEDSCGTIECAECFDKLNIKSLGYSDILHVIAERVTDCVNCADGLFRTYRDIEGEAVPNTRRRVTHYCNEHGIPERVGKYAVAACDDAGLVNGDFGDIIAVFSNLGFADEVKPSSERKLQKLAGHIVTKAHSEDRCDKCDALSVE